jgi:hypothetical protein
VHGVEYLPWQRAVAADRCADVILQLGYGLIKLYFFLAVWMWPELKEVYHHKLALQAYERCAVHKLAFEVALHVEQVLRLKRAISFSELLDSLQLLGDASPLGLHKAGERRGGVVAEVVIAFDLLRQPGGLVVKYNRVALNKVRKI